MEASSSLYYKHTAALAELLVHPERELAGGRVPEVLGLLLHGWRRGRDLGLGLVHEARAAEVVGEGEQRGHRRERDVHVRGFRRAQQVPGRGVKCSYAIGLNYYTSFQAANSCKVVNIVKSCLYINLHLPVLVSHLVSNY